MAPVAISMWYSATRLGPDVTYKPNHFVLLMPRSDVQPDTVSVSDDKQDDNTDHDDVNSSVSDDDRQDNADNDEDSGNTSHSSADDSAENVKTAIGMVGLPDDDWLTTEQVVQFLQQPPPDIRHQTAPTGHKDNSYCIVDNIGNTERHRRGQRWQYDDDCGA